MLFLIQRNMIYGIYGNIRSIIPHKIFINIAGENNKVI